MNMGERERREEPDVIESEIKLLLYYYYSIRDTDAIDLKSQSDESTTELVCF